MSIRHQCELLGVSRSMHYYQPMAESALNLRLLRLMDERYLEHPYLGRRRMQTWLARAHDLRVNIKRLNRLYHRVLGLQAVAPGPHTSTPNPAHPVYPYLLKGLTIERPNQVWQTDITYIPMRHGYLYLTAWIDVYSRYLLHWTLSNTMTTEWCVRTWWETVEQHGRPEIVNTDQGSQYTSRSFTQAILSESSTRLSMDGKGRATDNVYIERFWRSAKYERIYPHDFVDGKQLHQGLDQYICYYNTDRDHQGINYQLPHNLFFTGS